MVILVATERKIPEVELLIDLILHSLENPAAVKDPKGRDFRDYSFKSLILNVNKQKGGPKMGNENITMASAPTIRKGSRQSIFEAIDNPALRPLPYTQYVYSDYVIRRTPANYHVEYDDFHYSVPHELYKQLVTIRATATTIEILNDNRE